MYLFLFIFGLIVGSFINVVSLRYVPGQKVFGSKAIGGRSHCFHCGKTLVWYELIPIVSFLIQRAKCRNCGQKLSFQYPIVEILSGLIFLFVPITQFPNSLITSIWILVFLLLLLISIIDFRHSIIPDSLNLSLAILGIILIFITRSSFLGHYALLFGLRENIWLNYLIAGFVGVVFFGLIIFLSRGKAMGMGDLKLAAALGLIFGWPDILMVLFLSFLSGALMSAVFLLLKKKKIKDMIPFGPFLASGSCLTFFFGYQIINLYFRIFNF